MIKKFLQKAAAFVLCTVCFLAFAPDAAAAQLQGLPGQELWQPYLEKAPQSAESFAKDPLKSLLALLPGSPEEMIRQMAHCYADVLLFLLLLIVLSFLVGGAADSALLELAAAVGCGTLLWGDLISLAQLICERMEGWKNYLLGFLPVYSGVLAAGGEVNASTAASGLLLTFWRRVRCLWSVRCCRATLR
jgi:stage III sporulation protein AE